MSWSALSSGDAVEVLSGDGDAATWRPARIVHPFLTRRLYFVTFECGAARATVAADRVRPRPVPSDSSSGSGFELHQLVDAKIDGVWRPGVVSKAHVAAAAGEEGKYGVCFPHAREEMEFRSEDVRARLDWVDGKWVSAEEKNKTIRSRNVGVRRSVRQNKLLHASNTARKRKVPGSTTHLSGCGDEACGQVPISTPNPENENADRSTSQAQQECSQHCKKAKKGETTEDNTGLLGLRDTEPSSLKAGVDVCSPIIEEEPRFHIKSLVGKCCFSSSFEKMNVKCLGSIAKSSSNILSEDSLIPEKLSHEDKPVSNKVEELHKERPANSEFLRMSEWCPSQQREELVPVCERQRDEGVRQHTSREKRRKNSKPKKVKIIEPSLEGDSMGNQRDSKVVSGRGPTTKYGKCSVSCLETQEVMVGSSYASLVETSSSGVQLSEAGGEARDRLLLTTARKLLEQGYAVEKSEDSFKPRLDKSPEDQSPLLFKKSSSMWDSIESMKVFSVMPQCPHFRPLEQYHKDFREGMAIGLMVTFSNLFNSIGKLQIADSRHKFDDLLKPLVNLETHGFDVQRLRAHLVKLLRMKENQERLVDEKSALEVLLIERIREKDRLNLELELVEKAARELEQSLSFLQEEKLQISEQKRENDSNLDKLEMDSRRVEQSLLSAEQDFEATVSSQWYKKFPESKMVADHQGSFMARERHDEMAGDVAKTDATKELPSESKISKSLKPVCDVVKKSSKQKKVFTEEYKGLQSTQGNSDMANNVDEERDSAMVKDQRDEGNKEKIDGMIFMCNANTRPDEGSKEKIDVDKERDSAMMKDQRDEGNKDKIDGMIFMCNANTRPDEGNKEKIDVDKERDSAMMKDQRDEGNKEKIDGMIFMCNANTRPDCFHYMVMGLPQSKKEVVATIKPGLKLFLYDYNAKLLYGIYEATSPGGMNLEPTAFNGSFPAQVRFKVHLDCFPLSEGTLRMAVMGKSSSEKTKFNTELTTQQVKELINLFQRNPVPQSIVGLPVHSPQQCPMSVVPQTAIVPAIQRVTVPQYPFSFGERECWRSGCNIGTAAPAPGPSLSSNPLSNVCGLPPTGAAYPSGWDYRTDISWGRMDGANSLHQLLILAVHMLHQGTRLDMG